MQTLNLPVMMSRPRTVWFCTTLSLLILIYHNDTYQFITKKNCQAKTVPPKMIDKVALFLWHVLQSQMIAKQRERSHRPPPGTEQQTQQFPDEAMRQLLPPSLLAQGQANKD